MRSFKRKKESNMRHDKTIEGESFTILRVGGFMGFRHVNGDFTVISEDSFTKQDKDIAVKVDGEYRNIPNGQMKELLYEINEAENDNDTKRKNS